MLWYLPGVFRYNMHVDICYYRLFLMQEFYTSSQSNIRDAQGQDALVSLVGSIATGLTWGGSIFVNPMISRIYNVKLVTMTGVFLMSLGLFTASYSTEVSATCFMGLKDIISKLSILTALASIYITIHIVRHWCIDVLFSCPVTHPSLFRPSPWLRNGLHRGWIWRGGCGFGSGSQISIE